MQSANLSGPLKGRCLYKALIGLTQASGLAGGFDFMPYLFECTFIRGCTCATQMGQKGGTSRTQAAHPMSERRQKRGNRFPDSLSKVLVYPVLLAEVALQQALESLAVAGKPHGNCPMGTPMI